MDGHIANAVTIIGGVVGVAGFLAFVLAYFKSGLAKQTIAIHEQNRQALEDRVKILEESDNAKTKKISELEGEVKTLKDIPLGKLANNYETMAKTLSTVSDTQKKMLDVMTAAINKSNS